MKENSIGDVPRTGVWRVTPSTWRLSEPMPFESVDDGARVYITPSC